MTIRDRLTSLLGRFGGDHQDGKADKPRQRALVESSTRRRTGSDDISGRIDTPLLPEDQRAHLEQDMEWLGADSEDAGRRLQKEAEKTVQTAVEDSVKRVYMFNMGRCPNCNERLSQHLFAAICERCGWTAFEKPRSGPVRVHLLGGNMPIVGSNCYATKDMLVLIKDDAVAAQIPRRSVSWVEYVWTPQEMEQRYKQLVSAQEIRCGWCNEPADPEKEGFSLVQVAFGTTQERYVFCSDPCYEAFRKTYPSRVHRNCYERNCAECNLCLKRYDDEADGVRLMAKDFLRRKPEAIG